MSFKECAEHCTLLSFAAREMEDETLARRYGLHYDLGQAALQRGLPEEGIVQHVTAPLENLDRQISDMADFFESVDLHDCPGTGNPPLFDDSAMQTGRVACRATEAGVPKSLQDRIEAYYFQQRSEGTDYL